MTNREIDITALAIHQSALRNALLNYGAQEYVGDTEVSAEATMATRYDLWVEYYLELAVKVSGEAIWSDRQELASKIRGALRCYQEHDLCA